MLAVKASNEVGWASGIEPVQTEQACWSTTDEVGSEDGPDWIGEYKETMKRDIRNHPRTGIGAMSGDIEKDVYSHVRKSTKGVT